MGEWLIGLFVVVLVFAVMHRSDPEVVDQVFRQFDSDDEVGEGGVVAFDDLYGYVAHLPGKGKIPIEDLKIEDFVELSEENQRLVTFLAARR